MQTAEQAVAKPAISLERKEKEIKPKKQKKNLLGPTIKYLNPYPDSLLNSLFVSKLAFKCWIIHAFVLLILYSIWLYIYLTGTDLQFSITHKEPNEIWANIFITQAICWFNFYDTIGALYLLAKFGKAHRERKNRVYLGRLLDRTGTILLAIFVSSLGCYGIISCYWEHLDTATLICPAVIFIFISHISSILFKSEFYKKTKKIEEAISKEELRIRGR